MTYISINHASKLIGLAIFLLPINDSVAQTIGLRDSEKLIVEDLQDLCNQEQDIFSYPTSSTHPMGSIACETLNMLGIKHNIKNRYIQNRAQSRYVLDYRSNRADNLSQFLGIKDDRITNGQILDEDTQNYYWIEQLKNGDPDALWVTANNFQFKNNAEFNDYILNSNLSLNIKRLFQPLEIYTRNDTYELIDWVAKNITNISPEFLNNLPEAQGFLARGA